MLTVAMISGAMWREGQPEAFMLGGVDSVLSPYGTRGTWTGSSGSWSIALHRFDSTGGSPFVTPAGAVVCADVFLSQPDELRRRLGAGLSATDIELVGLAYDRWGNGFCSQLGGGRFAVAVFDPRRHGLLLARDHAGSAPLAVHERDGVIGFASTSLALTGLPGVGHELDRARLAELAVAAYGSCRTFVQTVESVDPGSWRWNDGATRRTERWWHPERIDIVDRGTVADHAAALRHEFERSVRSTLRGVERPGVLLSGGLDSTSVAAIAAPRQMARRGPCGPTPRFRHRAGREPSLPAGSRTSDRRSRRSPRRCPTCTPSSFMSEASESSITSPTSGSSEESHSGTHSMPCGNTPAFRMLLQTAFGYCSPEALAIKGSARTARSGWPS